MYMSVSVWPGDSDAWVLCYHKPAGCRLHPGFNRCVCSARCGVCVYVVSLVVVSPPRLYCSVPQTTATPLVPAPVHGIGSSLEVYLVGRLVPWHVGHGAPPGVPCSRQGAQCCTIVCLYRYNDISGECCVLRLHAGSHGVLVHMLVVCRQVGRFSALGGNPARGAARAA
jgi:hypothetical protein